MGVRFAARGAKAARPATALPCQVACGCVADLRNGWRADLVPQRNRGLPTSRKTFRNSRESILTGLCQPIITKSGMSLAPSKHPVIALVEDPAAKTSMLLTQKVARKSLCSGQHGLHVSKRPHSPSCSPSDGATALLSTVTSSRSLDETATESCS